MFLVQNVVLHWYWDHWQNLSNYCIGIQFRNYMAAVFAYATPLWERVQVHHKRVASKAANGNDGCQNTV